MNKLTQWIKQLLQAATPTVSSSAWDQYRLARKLSPTAQPIETQRDAVVVNMHRRNRAS